MIVISDTELENALKKLLQENLRFLLNKKVWKEGRLLLFKQSGFYLEFIINSKKKPHERFEVPIPFNIEFHNSGKVVYFDYQLTSLVGKNHESLLSSFKMLKPQGKSKFFDTILRIECI